MELWALPWLQDTEYNHADERAEELRQRGIDIKDSKIQARELARGCDDGRFWGRGLQEEERRHVWCHWRAR